MTVFLLMEEKEQPDYFDNYGEQAYPTCSVYAIYSDKERAEKERQRLSTEPGTSMYYVEERPIL